MPPLARGRWIRRSETRLSRLVACALGLAQLAQRALALVAGRAVQDQDTVEVVDLVLDHAGLEPRGLHEPGLAVLVERAHAHVHRALHVDGDPGYREAALVEHVLIVADPFDLRVRERVHGRVRADPVDEQPLRDPELRRREPHSEGVAHDSGHAAHLLAEGVVEAVHRRGARLQHGVAQAADERHGRHAPRLGLGIERRDVLRRALELLDLSDLPLLRHRGSSVTRGAARVYCGSTSTAKLALACSRAAATSSTAWRTATIARSRSGERTTSCAR